MKTTKEDHNVSGDFKSLQLLSSILILKGSERVEYGHKGDGYDILSVKDDKMTVWNVKQRRVYSYTYGDICISKPDFEALKWAQNNTGADKIKYVYFFKDVMFISDENGWSEKTLYAPQTQRFLDHVIVEKPCKYKLVTDESLTKIDYRKINFNNLLNPY